MCGPQYRAPSYTYHLANCYVTPCWLERPTQHWRQVGQATSAARLTHTCDRCTQQRLSCIDCVTNLCVQGRNMHTHDTVHTRSSPHPHPPHTAHPSTPCIDDGMNFEQRELPDTNINGRPNTKTTAPPMKEPRAHFVSEERRVGHTRRCINRHKHGRY